MCKLEFFFDISSPWTYLAFTRIIPLAEQYQVKILWRPILVGGVFNKVNQDVYAQRTAPNPIKGRYYIKDLQDWAQFCNIKIGNPPVFPVHAVELMRTALVAQEADCLPKFALAAFEAYWGELRDVSDPKERAAICTAIGLKPKTVEHRIQDADIKARLRTNTDELTERGGFGSPTIFINTKDMYFGNDRLPLVEAALKAVKPQ